MHLRILLLFSCFVIVANTNAQLLDSIAMSLQEKGKFILKMDNRGSFISTRSASIWGVKIGVEHNDRVQYGLGYSWLLNKITRTVEVDGETKNYQLKFGYITPFFEYAFYQRNKWEVSIPVQLGIGRASYQFKDSIGQKQNIAGSWVFLYEPAMTVEYRLLPFFGLGLGVGYRLGFKTNPDLDENINAPTYMLKLKLYLPKTMGQKD